MKETNQTELDELKALTSELEDSMRGLKRVMADDREQTDRDHDNPEALLEALEADA